VYFAEETKNARRTIARAVLSSAVVTILAEIIPLAAILLGTNSLSDLFSADLPVEAFLDERAGHAVTVFVLVSIALAIVNAIIAIALQSGRLLFAAARDQAMPEAIAAPLTKVSATAKMPWVATLVMGVLAVAGCLVPIDVLLNATGSTLAFSYGFIALSAIVMRRKSGKAGYLMPLWPLPPVIALVAIATIFVMGLLDPNQWLSLGIAVGIVATGFLYYFCYLRSRAGTHLLLLEVSDEEDA
jgi:amino acid transporter